MHEHPLHLGGVFLKCFCFQFYTFDDIIALSTNAFGDIETQACGTST